MDINCYLSERCNLYKSGKCKLINDEVCAKFNSIDYMFDLASLSDFQKQMPVFYDDHVDDEKYALLRGYENQIDRFVKEGHSLILHSPITGNGKTTWALRLLQSYIIKTWTSGVKCKALFVNTEKFLRASKADIKVTNEYYNYINDNILKADLVVFDEVGIKGLTDFEHDLLYTIIDERVSNGKSNIYTSNRYGNDLKSLVGDRLYSRIVNKSYDIEFMGGDKRSINK